MKSSIDLATQGAIEMKTLSKHHIEAIEKAKTELGKVNAARLYRACDFPAICRAISEHALAAATKEGTP